MTKYQVYRVVENGLLDVAGYAEAHSGETAIRKIANDSGLYIAVPTRSITARLVTVQTTTRVRVEPA